MNEIDPENPLEIPENWPNEGEIKFENVTIKYNKNDPN